MEKKLLEEKKVVELSIDEILPNRFQPRIKFDDSAIFELSESIKSHGVFQPIIVRPIGDKYEIIAGERRYKASVLANKKTIPAIIMDLNDNDTVEIALIENVQRANLTPIEEAISYKKILDMGYMNQEQLAQKLGKTQSTIANKLRLLNLDEDVQEALLENKISERHARSILKLKDYSQQKTILQKIIKERLTVRKTDEEIDKMINGNNDNNENPIIIEPVSVNSSVLPSSDDQVSIIEETPISTPIFSDVNNEIINPTNITTNLTNSTVMGTENNNNVENLVSPTVMDIDKIEKNAKDVFVQKEVAPMEQILSSEKKEEIPVVEETPQDMLRPGKFFNFMPIEEESNQTINNQDYNASKNFNFDNLYNDVTQPSNVEITPSTPIELKNDPVELNEEDTIIPVMTNDNISTPFGFVEPVTNNPSTPFGFGNIDNNTNLNPSTENNSQSALVDSDTITIPTFNDFTQYNPVDNSFSKVNNEKNVIQAVEIIRDAVKKIENLGFDIDVDEIDLETIYQLIIKIEK